MAERDGGNGVGPIGGNGRTPGDGRVFDELNVLSDEDLELLVGRAEDEDELRSLAEEGEAATVQAGGEGDEGEPDEPGRARRHAAGEEREPVALRLFPDAEYEPVAGVPAELDAEDVIPHDGGNGDGSRSGLVRARQILAPVEAALRAEGFYAYGTLDDANRWIVAVDDEDGRVDVHLAADGYVLDLRATSPGLYADVDHPFRRRRLERAAREVLPRIARGLLEPHQTTDWDEVDQGVAVGLRYVVPFARGDDIGRIVRDRLPELDDLLAMVEERVAQ